MFNSLFDSPFRRFSRHGIFGFGGSSSGGTSKTSQKQNSTSTSNQTTNSSTSATSNEKDKSLIQSLSDEAIKVGTDFLTGFVKNESDPNSVQEQTKSLANNLISRAQGADQALLSQGDAIFAEARRSGQEQLQRLNTDLAQQAGGVTGNSFVAGATGQAAVALESRLASSQAEFNISSRNSASQEMISALNGGANASNLSNSSAQSISQLIQSLKGAETSAKSTSDKSAKSNTTAESDLITKLDALLTQNVKTKNWNFNSSFGT